MKIPILLISLFVWISVGCGNKTNETQTVQNEKNDLQTPNNDPLPNLKLEASRLRAGGSIKNVELQGKTAKIYYVKDYEEYTQQNPQSTLTQSDLEAYWESGDAIEKALVDGGVRIMKKMDNIDTVSIVLPYKETIYSISVNKNDLEKFVGSNFSTIKEKWNEIFSNPYVYNDEGRKAFFSKFGKKEIRSH